MAFHPLSRGQCQQPTTATREGGEQDWIRRSDLNSLPIQATSPKLRNERIPSIENTRLKVIEILRCPIRLLLHRICDASRKGNIQHIRPIMAVVAVDALPVARRCKGDTCFAYEGFSVIAVLVAPDAVDLVVLADYILLEL